MVDVSVVIVAYESELDISDCIDSVAQHISVSGINVEIIVVDNSPDESARLTENAISAKTGSAVRYCRAAQNLGYGKGNNFGVSKCSGSLICVMNPDARMTENLLGEACSRFSKNRNLAMLGFKQLGGKNLSFYFYPTIFIPIFGSIILKLFNKLDAYLPNLFFLSGALVFIERNKFLQVGGYDENFFLYCEDADLAKSFRGKKYDLDYCKDLRYEHRIDVVSRSNRQTSSLVIEYESMAYFFEKYKASKKWYCFKKFIDFKFHSFVFFFFTQRYPSALKENFYLFLRKFYGK